MEHNSEHNILHIKRTKLSKKQVSQSKTGKQNQTSLYI